MIDELEHFERLCLELAGDSTMPEERAGLLEMAANYQAEADHRAARFPFASPLRKSGSKMAVTI
ncbi:hypothetical protein IVA98_05680 [Bradyrhizobium sp. 160]|uniref:hypothetical protein n=1 Tax=Bradyrhizobium sp. 160 TaxID=2782634 RepID=UPI001FF83048|nr:hypothetical protein [Bradyrhizobium sp. 160]MCK1622743.1 hypothetical protein [Bradyrhizobium sp. 160]